LGFVRPAQLAGSFDACLLLLDVLEGNRTYVSQNPMCEPQLGKRGLYHSIGGFAHSPENEMAMLWVLNLADGDHSLLDVAERADLPFDLVRRAADVLRDQGLVKEGA
jgi:aminopeptidase-like protein